MANSKEKGTFKLEEVEILKLKNIGLQRQLLEKEKENLSLQEALIVKAVSSRVGTDVSKWKFDFQKQIVYE